jgi:PEP-CTERM motif
VNRKIFFLAIVASLLMVKNASATLSYTYTGILSTATPTAGTVNGTYTVAGGSTVTVNLYLVEVATSGTSSMIAAAGGLFSGALNTTLASANGSPAPTITAAAGNSNAYPAGFATINTFVYNNIGAVGGTGSSASIQNISDLGKANPPGPSGSTTGGFIVTSGNNTTTYVYLGNVTITVGATANAKYSVTSFHDAPNGTFNSGSFFNTMSADDASANTADLDVTNNADQSPNPSYYQAYTGADGNGGFFILQTSTSTPEPSSMLLCGLAVCGMGFGYLRRRKLKLAAAAEEIETPAIA